MAMQTPKQLELSPNDLVQFVEYHRPTLKAGDYTLTIKHVFEKYETQPTSKKFGHFSVQGERYSLKPDEIHALYPPPGGNGPFSHALPHIILNRNTLPWERTPLNSNRDELLSPTWLGLLLFTQEEAPTPQTITVGALQNVSTNPAWPWESTHHEISDHANDPVVVIDVPWGTLKTILPTYEDLRYSAHTRQVQHQRASANPEEMPELAVIMGNRLPPSGERCTVHLVSLEYRYKPGNDDPTVRFEDGRAVYAANHIHDFLKPLVKNVREKANRTQHPVEIHLRSDTEDPEIFGLRDDIQVSADSGLSADDLIKKYTPDYVNRLCQSIWPDAPVEKAGQNTILVQDSLGIYELALQVYDKPVAQVFNKANGGKGRVATTRRMAVFERRRQHQPLSVPTPQTDEQRRQQNMVLEWLEQAHQKKVETIRLVQDKKLEIAGESVSGMEDPISAEALKAYAITLLPVTAVSDGDSANGAVHVNFQDGTAAVVYISVREAKVEDDGVTKWVAMFNINRIKGVEDDLRTLLETAHSNGATEIYVEAGHGVRFLGPVTLENVNIGGYQSSEVETYAYTLLPDSWQKRYQLRSRVNRVLTVEFGTQDYCQLEVGLVKETYDKKAGQQIEKAPLITCIIRVQPTKMIFFDSQGAGDETNIRLVSLKSWDFTCEPETGKGFVELLKGLNQATVLSDGIQPIPNAAMHLPLPTQDAEEEGEGEKDVEKKAEKIARSYLQAGYVPLPHQLRQGDRTISWYRSPLVPVDASSPTFYLPVRSADELLLFNQAIGMFDASYASAWELGRMLALQDKDFSVKLLHWKRAHAQTLTYQRQRADHDYLPIIQNIPDDATLPPILHEWFLSLTRLEGLPFNYLVPDERLLPPESIRFFRVDPSWLEALRDGAFSIGRVAHSDYQADFSRWRQLARTPNISGFLLRSAVVGDWPGLAVNGYTILDPDGGETDDWETVSHLNESAYQSKYTELSILRFDRLAPNLLLCLFYDDQAGESACNLDLLDIHLRPETLHFGLELAGEQDAAGHQKFIKKLRDPQNGNMLGIWLQDIAQVYTDQYIQARITQATLDACAPEVKAILANHKEIINKPVEKKNDPLSTKDFLSMEDSLKSELEEKLSADEMGQVAKTWTTLWNNTYKNILVQIDSDEIPWKYEDREQHVLDLTSLFALVADPLTHAVHNRALTAADFALQMIDAAPLVRFLRRPMDA